MTDEEFKRRVFDLVRARLEPRSDSLIRFCKHWHGSSSGIEGWFKLEFAAAIEPEVAIVRTGGAGGRGQTGKVFPDLILETQAGIKIPVEAKAGASGWYYGGSDVAVRYKDRLLVFLSPAETPISAKHRQKVEALDPHLQLAPICEIQTPKGSRTFYFGMADLRTKDSSLPMASSLGR